MAHFGQVVVLRVSIEVETTDMVIGARTMSSRSCNGRRVICCRAISVANGVEADLHTAEDIDPDDPTNIKLFAAFE